VLPRLGPAWTNSRCLSSFQSPNFTFPFRKGDKFPFLLSRGALEVPTLSLLTFFLGRRSFYMPPLPLAYLARLALLGPGSWWRVLLFLGVCVLLFPFGLLSGLDSVRRLSRAVYKVSYFGVVERPLSVASPTFLSRLIPSHPVPSILFRLSPSLPQAAVKPQVTTVSKVPLVG